MRTSFTTILASACLAALIPGTANAGNLTSRAARTEATLSAAGFRSIPDTSPEVAQILATAPQGKLRAEPSGGEFTYVFSDPQGCGCVLEGNEAQYQRYQALALAQRNAELNSTAYYGRLVPPGAFGSWGWNAGLGYGPFGYAYRPYGFGGAWYHPVIGIHFGGGYWHRR